MNKVSKVRDSIEIMNISYDNDENNIDANCYSQSGYSGPKEVDHLIINFGKMVVANWQYLNDKNDIIAKFPRQSLQGSLSSSSSTLSSPLLLLSLSSS